MVDLSFPLANFNEICEEGLCEDSVLTYSQKQLSFKIDKANHEQLLSVSNSTREKARLLSVGLPKAGCWMNAIPSKALGLHLSNLEFQATVKYRLGLPVFSRDGPCVGSGAPSDRFGYHAVSYASRQALITELRARGWNAIVGLCVPERAR